MAIHIQVRSNAIQQTPHLQIPGRQETILTRTPMLPKALPLPEQVNKVQWLTQVET